MAMKMAGLFWRMPRRYPTASTIITGILGIVLFIEGIVLATTPSTTGQSNVPGGIIVCVISLIAVGLAAYAAYETQYFHNWKRSDGSYGHVLARCMGPLLLTLALIEVIIILWVISMILSGFSRR
jgi:amino acid transporter